MSAIVSQKLKLSAVRSLISATANNKSPLYVFTGDSTSPSVNNQVYDDHFSLSVDAYDGMLFAKMATWIDSAPMIRRIDYVANTVYAMYDDSDPELFQKDFYVCVESGDFVHVFKCLDNNRGGLSTISPNFTDVDPGDVVYRTSDGYQWKYMYTVEDTAVAKFSGSSGHVPVMANSGVSEYAVHGALDVIMVTDRGEGYDNHLSGVFSASHIKVSGNAYVYSVVSNTLASTSNGFYTGCVLSVTNGDGAGSYRRIVDYFSSVAGRFVVLESPFTDEPTNNSEWEISPEVVVFGSGSETERCEARAIINAVGNTVERVEVLYRGAGYEKAVASVIANDVVGVIETARVRPVYSPFGGHGRDAALELGCTKAGVSVRFSNTEGGVLPVGGRFGQIGVLKDPVFSNVGVLLANETGSISAKDELMKITERLMVEGASVTLDSNTVTAEANLELKFENGDWVSLWDEEEGRWFLTDVDSVTNSSTMILKRSLEWSSSNVQVFLATPVTNAKVIRVIDSNVAHLSELREPIWTGDILMVKHGTGRATVSEIHLSGEPRNFSTILQTIQLDGTPSSGTIQLNEMVFQGSIDSPLAYGYVSAIGNSRIYVTRSWGKWDDDEVLQGAASGALFGITDIWEPEFVMGSGEVLYLETMDGVTRSNSQSEVLSFVVSF